MIMKKQILSLTVLLFIPLFLYAQADKITGIWLTEEGNSQVEIKKDSEDRYFGKIIWLEEPLENGKPKVDDENPDPKLQSRPLLGLQLVENFRYSSKKGNWQQGLIYDPDNGKTYDCFVWFE
ncbi:MAG TPA: DUF2147 domain-containing protein, partial [Bacteroidaceae bacterium]|nr:DUF2147 domain-containing protein [Bacteroidaceae bacterium]